MKRSEYYEERALDRIISLSDAVFAFSLTLQAVDLIVPELKPGEISQLSSQLLGEWPRFVYFLLTFLITGAFWFSHHRTFRFIRRYDDMLMRLNLYYLLFIVVMPFTTKLLNEYGQVQITVIIAALSYAIPGLLLSLMWHYASKGHYLIDNQLPPEFIKLINLKNLITPSVFIISIPFSFIKPSYSMYFWIILIPVGMLIEHFYGNIIEKD